MKKMNPKARARLERQLRVMLRQNRVCVVNVNEPYSLQTTFHHGNCKLILADQKISTAICDISNVWTIYLAVFCDSGEQWYMKSIELQTDRPCKPDRLTEIIKSHHMDLVTRQNQKHVVSSGWIAFPYEMEMDPPDAARLFDSAIEVSREYVNVQKPQGLTI